MKNHSIASLLLFCFCSYSSFAQTERVHSEREKHAIKDRHPLPKRQNSVVVLFPLGGLGGYAAISPGLEYERFFTKKNKFSLMTQASVFVNGTLTLGYTSGSNSIQTTGFYITPGVRYHPLGNQKKLDLGIGASFAIGNSKQVLTFHNSYGTKPSPPYNDKSTFSAIIGQVSCTFRFRSPLVIGVNIASGYIISQANVENPGRKGQNADGYLMLGLRIGRSF